LTTLSLTFFSGVDAIQCPRSCVTEDNTTLVDFVQYFLKIKFTYLVLPRNYHGTLIKKVFTFFRAKKSPH